MARPRTPTAILEGRGAYDNHPERRSQRREEPIAPGAPLKPRFLKGRAAKIWDELLPEILRMKVAGAIDSRALATLCCLEAEHEENPKNMSVGRIAEMRKHRALFGMDPSSRARLSVPQKPPADGAEEFFPDSQPDAAVRPGSRLLQ